MQIFPEHKSKALSAAFLTGAAFSCVMAFRAFSDLADILAFFSAPVFLPAMRGSVLPLNVPPLAGFMVTHTRLFFVFFPLFWFSSLIVFLGLWRRAQWARRGAAAILYLFSLTALLLLFSPWLVIPRPLFYGDISLAPEFNSAVKTAAFYTRLLALAGGSLCLWWALALDRGSARAEFDASPKE